MVVLPVIPKNIVKDIGLGGMLKPMRSGYNHHHQRSFVCGLVANKHVSFRFHGSFLRQLDKFSEESVWLVLSHTLFILVDDVTR